MRMYAWFDAGDGDDPELAQRTHREGVKSENRPRRATSAAMVPSSDGSILKAGKCGEEQKMYWALLKI